MGGPPSSYCFSWLFPPCCYAERRVAFISSPHDFETLSHERPFIDAELSFGAEYRSNDGTGTAQSQRHTAVDGEAGAGHVAGLLAGEVSDQTGNLVGISGALERNERLDRLNKISRHVRDSWPGLN